MKFKRIQIGDLIFETRIGCFDSNPLREEITDDCYKIPKDAKVVIDIGAHIGGTSILCAKMGATVYAYEPQKETYELLKKNIELNNVGDNIKHFNLGVGNTGKRKLYLHNRNSGAHCMSLNFNESRVKDIEEINVISLRKVFASNNIEECDLLKSDCEGAEFEFLMNINAGIALKIKQISLEYHDIKKVNDLKEVLKLYYNVEDNGRNMLYCYLKKIV